ncbi:exodeoxyribonuclease VII large subunit [uncultured Ezakiella sp.]|uniref:exodeoxyribonuclease VII large subunit n=1 Tax=uncultured Ezakiella sp. TaxID=1637529 RepID=UPI0025EB2DF8|nr:exodeoxyribonuclease VII large subunit [uncultured Ezakiella sp.]
MIEFSVSAINNYIKNLLANDINLRSIAIEGEVCAFKEPSKTGHLYFELKDEDSRIRCVFFNIYSKYDEIPFEEGDSVVLNGRVDVYEKSGQYQFIASEAKVQGLGDLYIKFLELKEQLEKEGLFDITKRQIPLNPKNIGLITSPSGSALRDFIAVIKRRYPLANIFLYPVHVQGVETVNEVCRAINYFNTKELDVVVLTRGGGSYEELAVFNNEKIARKLAESIHPTVSAIGHEPDYLITDFVSDLRAATPTAAAEIITPDIYQDIYNLEDRFNLMINSYLYYLNDERKNLKAIENLINLKSPIKKIKNSKEQLVEKNRTLNQFMRLSILKYKNQLKDYSSQLIPFDTQKILDKGYTITVDEDGKLLSEKVNYNKGDKLKTIFDKGSLISEII